MTAPAISIASEFDAALYRLPAYGNQLLVSQEYGEAAEFWDRQEDIHPNSFEIALAHSLPKLGLVLWLSAERPTEAKVKLAGEEDFLAGLKRRWDGLKKLNLQSSTKPEGVVTLFDAEGMNWSMQGQIVLLTQGSLKSIDRELVIGMMLEPETEKFPKFWTTGVDAMVLPGVDGACAGFYSAEAATIASFRKYLETTLDDMNVPYVDRDANRLET